MKKLMNQNELKMFPFNNYHLSALMIKANPQKYNKIDSDQKESTTSAQYGHQSYLLLFKKTVRDEKDEYSDPDMNDELTDVENRNICSSKNNISDFTDEESNYSDDGDDTDDDDYDVNDFDKLPEIDQINISKPEKLARYAETIFSVVRQDVSDTLSNVISSEIIKTTQAEITSSLHELAVKWILQVHQEYKMSSDTLYESITYLNTILSKTPVRQDQLQLVSVTCIWMASKVEERTVPKLEELSYICRYQYKEEDFVKCEKKILKLLDFRLSFPTSKMFLRRLLDAISAEAQIIEVATFFCDLSLIPMELIDFTPMSIAMASVCLGKICLNMFCPTQRLLAYSHLDNSEDVKKCACILLQHAQKVVNDKDHILYKKFTQDNLSGLIREIDLSVNLINKI